MGDARLRELVTDREPGLTGADNDDLDPVSHPRGRRSGETLALTVRVFPAGSFNLAVRRSVSLCSRASTRRSVLGSASLTVLVACAATLKALVFS